MKEDILHWWYRGNERNPHQAGKVNYTPNGHTQTLLIFYKAHSKLFHTLTLILQKKNHSYFTKRKREIFYDDFGVYFSLSGILWLSFASFSFFFFTFFASFFTCFSTEGTSSFYRSLEPWVDEEIRIQLELMRR